MRVGSEAIKRAHMFAGETVVVHFRDQTGVDSLGNAIWEDNPVEVEDVLVAPASYYTATEDIRPEGELGDYTLHFPKSFDGDLSHLVVDVRGVPCKVIGVPIPYTEENTPGAWWLKVDVEVIDG